MVDSSEDELSVVEEADVTSTKLIRYGSIRQWIKGKMCTCVK